MDENNLILNNNISYKLISPNQKIENDKERIKIKFNFNISRTSTNSSANKQSSVPTQQNSLVITNKNFKLNENFLKLNDKKNINIASQKMSKRTSNNFIKEIDKRNNLSHTNINKKEKAYIKTKENLTSIKKVQNHIPYKVNNTTINKKLFDKNNIITNEKNNKYTDINKDSKLFQENQNNLFQDSILKTQSIIDEIPNQNKNTENKITKKNNEKIDNISIEKEMSESFKKSSFSCSSKTSELHNDILNIKADSENEGNIDIVNNNNYIIKNYNGINNRNNYQYQRDEEDNIPQIYSPFMNDNSEKRMTEVNTMGLLDDDEYNQENRKKMLNNINRYFFIEDIIEKNNKFESLSFDKFNKISNKAKYKIISFCYDNYKNIMNSSKQMRNIIIEALDDIFSPCINDFNNKYKDILIIDNYKFNAHEFVKKKLKRKKFRTFCLYLKARILPKNEYLIRYGDVGFEISYKYKIKTLKKESEQKTNRTYKSENSYISKYHTKEEYIQIYKFDLRKDKNYPMWLSAERDEIFNSESKSINSIFFKILKKDELYQKHLIYSSPVININENDYIVFRIDLIENYNIIESISFNEPIVQSINKNYFHKTRFKQDQKFDKMRDCENELVINVWHDDFTFKEYVDKNIKYKDFLPKLKKTFQEYFQIVESKYDISKFVFIRLTMKAKKVGVLKKNIFSNKDIEIVDIDSPLTKECIPINFVNTFSLNKNLKIKIGTVIDFYLIE